MNPKSSSFNSLIDPSSKIPAYFKNYNLPILYSLLAIDFVFISLHALQSLGYLSDPNFSVTKRFGYGESFMYLNELFIAGCFLWLSLKFKRTLFYCWTTVFTYVLLDDSLDIHETLGYKIGAFLDQSMNLPAGSGGEAGEMIVFGFFGLILFIPLFISYFRTTNKHIKVATQDLLVLFAGILFFGIGVDILNDSFATGTFLNGFFGLLEDAGEMVMVSLTAWYTRTFVSHGDYVQQRKNAKATYPSLKKLRTAQDREPLQVGKDPQSSRPVAAQLKNKTA